MDPNAALAEIRELIKFISNPAVQRTAEGHRYDAHDLAEKVNDLDVWLTGGGFKPDAWSCHK
jgi:hypothetical protein